MTVVVSNSFRMPTYLVIRSKSTELQTVTNKGAAEFVLKPLLTNSCHMCLVPTKPLGLSSCITAVLFSAKY